MIARSRCTTGRRSKNLLKAETLLRSARVASEREWFHDAARLCQEALAIQERLLGPDHPELTYCLSTLGLIDVRRGRFRDAEPFLRRSLRLNQQALPAGHPNIAADWNNLGVFHEMQEQYDDAVAAFRESIAILEHAVAADHVDFIRPLLGLGLVTAVRGDYAPATLFIQRATRIAERRGTRPRSAFEGYVRLVVVHGAEGTSHEAVAFLRDASDRGSVAARQVLQELQQGQITALGRGVLELLRRGAQRGEAFAQNGLGAMHQHGILIAKDQDEAVSWYRKAAIQGHADAENNLGWMYEHGLGVKRDADQALHWYRKAANQGHAAGQNNVGWAFQNGLAGLVDYGEAATWYEKSARTGHPPALENLASLYARGHGVVLDFGRAYALYSLAGDREFARSRMKGLATGLTPAEIEAAERWAHQWRAMHGW